MRTICKTVYGIKHLARYYPDGFKRAHEKYQQTLELDYVSDEMMDSLKALCKAAGVKMRDWSLGAYNRGNNLSVSMPGDDATAELTGPRALAWLENNLYGALRVPLGPLTDELDANGKRTVKGRYYLIKAGGGLAEDARGRRGMPGQIESCPLTGVCYDEDFLDDLKKSIVGGRTLKEAFEDLADVFARLLEDEYESRQTEEYFKEEAETLNWEYDRHGHKV
jgi:hypothetical protein